jgi:hypothetical protein
MILSGHFCSDPCDGLASIFRWPIFAQVAVAEEQVLRK